MAVTLTRSDQEIQQMPLVELAYEILKVKKEPLYFRDIMQEIQALRNLSEAEVNEVIARVFTEINIDGRFVCVGQNVWGLNRWYPTDKVADRLSGKKFVRKATGDAFGDDDEDDEDYEDVEILDEDPKEFEDIDEIADPDYDADAAEVDDDDAADEEEYEDDELYDEDDEEEEEED